VTVAAPFWAYTTVGSGYYDTKDTYGICSNGLAAAHVAAIVALIEDRYPAYNPSSIVSRLTSTASHSGSKDTYIGYGIPDAAAAVGYAPPPPPPPLAVTISGPATVKPNVTCTWLANAVNGTTPYTYSWTVNSGDPIGTASSLTFTNIGTPFNLTVQVTDAVGAVASNSLYVIIAPGAANCMQ
jgi:hypothetical protein